MSRFLLVEDDALVGNMVSMNLEAEGEAVRWVEDGEAAMAALEEEPFDLILLDISLPGLDGLEVLRRVREMGLGTPVLMLTARSDIRTKVAALDAGADDYLPKPFQLEELLARVRALVRRSRADREMPANRIIRFDRYEVNLETRSALTNEGRVVLNEKEAGILALLVSRGGLPVTRADILDEVWGMDAFPVERTVDNYLLRLRRLFEPDPARPRHIITIRGAGYRFVP